MPNHRLDEDGELERQCTRCGEWWPADDEFFYRSNKDEHGLHSWCKACAIEKRKGIKGNRKLELAYSRG